MGSRLRTAAVTTVAVVASLLLGFVVGVLGAFQHAAVVTVGATRLPVGLVLALLALVLAEYVARDSVAYGLGPALVLVGWAVTVATFGTSRPEGDLVIPAGATGEAFIYGGFLLGAVVAATLAIRGRRPLVRASGADPVGR